MEEVSPIDNSQIVSPILNSQVSEKPKIKTWLIVLFVVISVFVLLIILFVLFTSKSTKTDTPFVNAVLKKWPPVDISECSVFPGIKSSGSTRTKDDCYYYIAEKDRDSGICNNIENSIRLSSCISNIAIIKLDIVLCRTVQETLAKDTCIYDISISTNVSYCNEMSEKQAVTDSNDNYPKDDCYYKLALATSNATLCMPIKGGRFLSQGDCLSKISQDSKNPESCLNVQDPIEKTNCLDSFLIPIAEKKIIASSVICDNYPELENQIRCRAVISNDVSECLSISDDNIQLRCVGSIAMIRNNIDVCELIKENSYYDYCYSNYAEKEQDITACLKILSEGNKNMCINNVVVSVKKSAICNELPNESPEKAICLGVISSTSSSISYT